MDRHRDHACEVGQSSVHPLCRSFFSLLVYLEDSEDGGGATRFYLDVPTAASASHENGGGDGGGGGGGGGDDGGGSGGGGGGLAMRQHDRPHRCVVADVVPWAGRAVVFPHRLLHESMPIASGRKLVVRGDVLYRQQV